MSTPSTVTALHLPNPLYGNQPHLHALPNSTSNRRQNHCPLNTVSKLACSSYGPTHSPPESLHHERSYTKQSSNHAPSLNHSHLSSAMSSSRPNKRTDWSEFYKNGVPKEVIVIDDSSPETSSQRDNSIETTTMRQDSQHQDKRRKTGASTVYDPVHAHRSKNQPPQYEDSYSASTNSSGRTASAMYSTAPTSLTSQASAGHRMHRLDDSRAGQKRKRSLRREEDSSEPEIITQNYSWSNYVPPPKPPVKAGEVTVPVVRDVSANCSVTSPHCLTNL